MSCKVPIWMNLRTYVLWRSLTLEILMSQVIRVI